MKKSLTIAIVLLALLAVLSTGCQRGDFTITPVFEGQPAPHDGFNFGPSSYVWEGQPVGVSGIVVYIKGVDLVGIIGTVEETEAAQLEGE